MADDTDVLLTFCGQCWEEIRHIEKQRATLTNLVILVASAVIGLIVQQGFARSFIALTILLILLGAYGIATTLKFYERYQFLENRLDYWYRRIDKLHPKAEYSLLRSNADEDHKTRTRYPRMLRIHVHWLWLILHSAISFSGILLLVIILIK